jgi:leucine-rich repeat protein SHOC2
MVEKRWCSLAWLNNNELVFFDRNHPFENSIRHDKNKHKIVSNFAELDFLKVVNLRKSRLDYIPEFKSKKIQFLDLSCNNLKKFPEWILGLNELKYLNLGSNELESIPDLAHLPLETLKLHKNKISDIKLLPKTLIFLNIFLNNFVKVPDFSHLSHLEFFSFGATQIKHLPDWICNFFNLKWLSLVVNEIEVLPKDFCNLRNLIGLRLTKNKLTTIPENIGLLKKLRDLSLYSNRLTSLPDSFFELSLKKLNLSKNMIKNHDKIFKTFSGIDYFSF